MSQDRNTSIYLINNLLNKNSIYENLSDTDKLECFNTALITIRNMYDNEVILNELPASNYQNKIMVTEYEHHFLSSYIIDQNISINEIISDFTPAEKILVHNLALSELAFIKHFLAKQEYYFSTFREDSPGKTKNFVSPLLDAVNTIFIRIKERFTIANINSDIFDLTIKQKDKNLTSPITQKILELIKSTQKSLIAPITYLIRLSFKTNEKNFVSSLSHSVIEIGDYTYQRESNFILSLSYQINEV